MLFFYGSLFLLTEPKFHSLLTLSSNNSRSKADTPNKFHIFGIVRTFSFTWFYPGYFSLWAYFEESVFYGKRPFLAFFHDHTENKIQTILIRTILKFDDLPIARFETDVPLFSKHMLEIAIPLKFWVPAHSKVSWSRTMTAKMSVFRPLFWRKSLFWPIPTQWTPPSVIHGWKATDLLFLMVKRKKYFLNPISRQNFANAFAETPNLNLEVCHMCFILYILCFVFCIL